MDLRKRGLVWKKEFCKKFSIELDNQKCVVLEHHWICLPPILVLFYYGVM